MMQNRINIGSNAYMQYIGTKVIYPIATSYEPQKATLVLKLCYFFFTEKKIASKENETKNLKKQSEGKWKRQVNLTIFSILLQIQEQLGGLNNLKAKYSSNFQNRHRLSNVSFLNTSTFDTKVVPWNDAEVGRTVRMNLAGVSGT